MSAHDWPEFEKRDDIDVFCPANRIVIFDGSHREFALIDKAQYNYAKVRIDACAGLPDDAISGVMKGTAHNYAAFKRIEQQRDALQQRCEELQPKLTVRLRSFPESNGKRNWTAMIVRVDKWNGLIGNCGGITVAHGELWNRVAYEAERAKLLIGERDTEPCILDYGDDIETPDQWAGEVRGGRAIAQQVQP